VGQPLGSRYVLYDLLGRGAMGQVFRGSVRDSAGWAKGLNALEHRLNAPAVRHPKPTPSPTPSVAQPAYTPPEPTSTSTPTSAGAVPIHGPPTAVIQRR
jgi:hypothetical protein